MVYISKHKHHTLLNNSVHKLYLTILIAYFLHMFDCHAFFQTKGAVREVAIKVAERGGNLEDLAEKAGKL